MSAISRDVADVRPPPRKPPRPRPKPPRAVTVLERPDKADPDQYTGIRIVCGKEDHVYLLHPIEADFGLGFELEKLDEAHELATVEVYHVNLAGQESTCTCPGHSYHGHCKHVDGLLALDAQGKLPRRLARQKMVACNRCQELTDAPGLCRSCQQDMAEGSAEEAWWQQQQEGMRAELDAAADCTDCPF